MMTHYSAFTPSCTFPSRKSASDGYYRLIVEEISGCVSSMPVCSNLVLHKNASLMSERTALDVSATLVQQILYTDVHCVWRQWFEHAAVYPYNHGAAYTVTLALRSLGARKVDKHLQTPNTKKNYSRINYADIR